jgi:hypothetical protein
MLPALAGMIGAPHHAQIFSVEIRSGKLFYLNYPKTTIFPISASYIAWDDRHVPPMPVFPVFLS